MNAVLLAVMTIPAIGTYQEVHLPNYRPDRAHFRGYMVHRQWVYSAPGPHTVELQEQDHLGRWKTAATWHRPWAVTNLQDRALSFKEGPIVPGPHRIVVNGRVQFTFPVAYAGIYRSN